MSDVKFIIKMAIAEQEDLRKQIDEYSKTESKIERDKIFNDIKSYVDNILETTFYDGLKCRFEKDVSN